MRCRPVPRAVPAGRMHADASSSYRCALQCAQSPKCAIECQNDRLCIGTHCSTRGTQQRATHWQPRGCTSDGRTRSKWRMHTLLSCWRTRAQRRSQQAQRVSQRVPLQKHRARTLRRKQVHVQSSDLDWPQSSGVHWQAVNAGEALVPARVGADSDSLASDTAADDSARSSSANGGEQSSQSCRRQSSSEGGSGDGRAQPRARQRSGGAALAKPAPRARSSGRATRQSTSSERSAEASSDCAVTSHDDSADVAGPSRRQAQPKRSNSADSTRQRDRRGMATRKRGRPAPGSLSEKALQGEGASPDTSNGSESDVPAARRVKRKP